MSASQSASDNTRDPTKLKEVGGFRLIAKIGQGGMGSVFKACQLSLDRIVALKILPPAIAKNSTFIERFQREARASAKLNHPNIVQGIDVGKDEATGLWYFAMELVEGPSLLKVLKEQRVIPEERVLKIGCDIARALECAANQGIVHRDIKPDNILLTKDGDAKLADLGLAKQLTDDSSMTQSGQAVGTPYYMAPEQVRGQADQIDHRTDIYALGGTLFHLLTGQPPFNGPTSPVIMSMHLTEPPPKANKVNPEISDATSRLITRMMQKKKEQRVQNAKELIAALEKIMAGEDTSAPVRNLRTTTGPRTPVSGSPSPKVKDNKNALIMVAGVAVAVAVAVVLALMRGKSDEKIDRVASNEPVRNTRTDLPVQPPPPKALKHSVNIDKKPSENKPPRTEAAEATVDKDKIVQKEDPALVEADQKTTKPETENDAPLSVPVAPKPPDPDPEKKASGEKDEPIDRKGDLARTDAAVEAVVSGPESAPAPKKTAVGSAAGPETVKTAVASAVERQPVPAGPKVAEAVKLIKELFKNDYQKRGTADRSALSKRLIKLAPERKDDPNSYYATLREARDIALSAGDIDQAWTAGEKLAETFAMDAGELKTSALSTIARSGVTGETAEKVYESGQALLEKYVNESQYDAAVRLLGPLDELARRTNNPELIRAVQARTKEVRTQHQEWVKIKPYFDKLTENPDDADSALAVGKYYILQKNDWERALRLLAKCSSPVLQKVAATDLTEPAQAEIRADVGDQWWAASEKETGLLKGAMQKRALNWYQQALDELSAPRKQQVEKRVQAAINAGTSIEGLKAAGLVFWVNPTFDQSGAAREMLSAAPPKNVGAVPVVTENGTRALKLSDTYPTYPVSESVKTVTKTGSAFVWFRMDKSMGAYNGLLFKGSGPGPKTGQGRTDFTIMGYRERVIVFFNWPEIEWPGVEGKTAFYSKHPIPLGKWTLCGATWDGATVTVYFNGERDASYKANVTPKNSDMAFVGLGCDPAGANQGFNGLMGGAMVFNRALTDAEVRQIYLMSGIQGK